MANKPKNVAGIENDSKHAAPGYQRPIRLKADHTESVGAAAAAKARRLATIGPENDRGARPSAGGTRVKKDDPRDSTRENNLPGR
jgi:hypothetical protein